jgi:hypothetical protein
MLDARCLERFEGTSPGETPKQRRSCRYVSSVDSGNASGVFAAANTFMLTAAAEPAPRGIDDPSSTASRLDRGQPSRLQLRDTLRKVHGTVAGRAGRDEQLAALADALMALDSTATARGTEPAGGEESALSYWTRRLRAEIDVEARPPAVSVDQVESLARRAIACADGMNFRLFYDQPRGLLSVGYRPAAGEPRTSRYGKARPARIRISAGGFIRSRKAMFPKRIGSTGPSHHQRAGHADALVLGRDDVRVAVPLLVMRRYPETLLGSTCRMAVRRQIQYGQERGVPWGISGPPTTSWTAAALISTGPSASRVLARRGLGDDLVIAP